MSDIVGYDIDGRPLRIGDVAIVVNDPEPPSFNGQVVTVLGQDEDDPDCVDVDYVPPGGEADEWIVLAKALRKLKEDHRPASESFEDMMRNLTKTGALT